MNSTTAASPKPGWISRITFRRIITSNRFIPEIDGFRFLAILIVIISHIFVQCRPPLGHGPFARLYFRAFEIGGHGVYLFFTISGFILALPFARHHLLGMKPVAIGSYFKRRLTRLEPPYVIAMLLRAAVLAVGFKAVGSLSSLGYHLLASLFYVHSLVFHRLSTINPPAWSLEVEIQFYILAPLLTSVFLIRPVALRRLVIFAVILVSGVASTLLIGPISLPSYTLLYFFQYFAAGFLLCDLYLTKTDLSLHPLLWDLIGVVSLVWILLSQSFYYPIILPFVTICLYMSGFYGRLVRGFFCLPFISLIGGMCYSIYLTHTAVLTLVSAVQVRLHADHWPVVAQAGMIYLLSFSGILLVGSAFFLLIERPCMDPAWPQQLYGWLTRRFRGRA